VLPLLPSGFQEGRQSTAACVQGLLWRRRRLLAEYFQNDNSVGFDVIDNAPGVVAVIDPKLVAVNANRGHWPRVRETDHLTLLKSPQEESGFNPSGSAERRGLDSTMDPYERLVRLSGHSDRHVKYDMKLGAVATDGITRRCTRRRPRRSRAAAGAGERARHRATKPWQGEERDEHVKPLNGIQLVRIQPGQRRNGQAGSESCACVGRPAR